MDQMLFLLNEKMRRILRIIGLDYLHWGIQQLFRMQPEIYRPNIIGHVRVLYLALQLRYFPSGDTYYHTWHHVAHPVLSIILLSAYPSTIRLHTTIFSYFPGHLIINHICELIPCGLFSVVVKSPICIPFNQFVKFCIPL